jgi:hypothetical protein
MVQIKTVAHAAWALGSGLNQQLESSDSFIAQEVSVFFVLFN